MIDIFNIDGKKVMTQNVSQDNSTLRINKLPAGVYFLKVSGADGTLLVQEKFVKE